MGWTIPEKSFDSVTLSGSPLQPGTATPLEEVKTSHACEVAASGTSSIWTYIHLEGSLDGENWYMLGSQTVSSSSGGTVVVLITASNIPALFVRTSGYGDGTSIATTWVTSG